MCEVLAVREPITPRTLDHVDAGSADGPTVVLLPGGLTGRPSFEALLGPLGERGLRAVAVEPIANERGSTGEVGDLSYDAEVERESLRLTLAEVAPGERVHLVGWSNGGRAALAFALGHPELVATVTAVEPAAWWLAPDDPGAAELEALVRSIAGREVPDEALVQFLENVRVAPAGTDLRALPQWPVWRGVGSTLSWYGPAMEVTAQAQLERVEDVRAPVLLARGTWTAPWLRQVVDVLAARLPDVRVVELEGGHACLLQDAPTFIEALVGHVSATRATG